MLLSNARIHKSSQGFTLAEVSVIVVIAGILAALVAPNLIGWFHRQQVEDALNSVRGALLEAQREAMKRSQTCIVTINSTDDLVTGDCLVTGTRNLRQSDLAVGFFGVAKSRVDMKSNTASTQFSYRGTNTVGSAGTIIFFSNGNSNEQRCLVISSPLGIIRTGTYTGNPSSNVNNNQCRNESP
jgi:type II secretory pathway pseudopilin PulG